MRKIKINKYPQRDRQQLQERIAASVERDPEPYLQKYVQDPRSHEGRYVSSDLMKETIPEYAACPFTSRPAKCRLPRSPSRHSRAAEPDSRAAQRNDRRATDSAERERSSVASAMPDSHFATRSSRQSPPNCARTVSALRSGDSSVE